MNDNKIMNKAADNIRILAASMVEKAKSGHPGGAMGGADFINTLYSEFLVYDPENPNWEGRDRFFLDPGHMAPMLYSQLCLIGKYTLEDLKQLRQWGSVTPGHPERELARGIENTSGPLGQGHTFAVGAAIAAKFLKARLGNVMNQTIYAYISDGGVQEEISQGAGRIAGNLGLDNLIMFYDANDIQLSTKTEVVTCEDTAKKYEAWGWYVQKIDGNDVDQIREAALVFELEPVGLCCLGENVIYCIALLYLKEAFLHERGDIRVVLDYVPYKRARRFERICRQEKSEAYCGNNDADRKDDEYGSCNIQNDTHYFAECVDFLNRCIFHINSSFI